MALPVRALRHTTLRHQRLRNRTRKPAPLQHPIPRHRDRRLPPTRTPVQPVNRTLRRTRPNRNPARAGIRKRLYLRKRPTHPPHRPPRALSDLTGLWCKTAQCAIARAHRIGEILDRAREETRRILPLLHRLQQEARKLVGTLKNQMNETGELADHAVEVATGGLSAAAYPIAHGASRAADKIDDAIDAATKRAQANARSAGARLNDWSDAVDDYLKNVGRVARSIQEWAPKAGLAVSLTITAYQEFSEGISSRAIGRAAILGGFTVASLVICGGFGPVAAIACGIAANVVADVVADSLLGPAGG